MLVGHHIRKSDTRAVSSEEVIEFGNKLDVSWVYFEVDAKINDEDGNFKWPFLMFLSKVLSHRHDLYEVVC